MEIKRSTYHKLSKSDLEKKKKPGLLKIIRLVQTEKETLTKEKAIIGTMALHFLALKGYASSYSEACAVYNSENCFLCQYSREQSELLEEKFSCSFCPWYKYEGISCLIKEGMEMRHNSGQSVVRLNNWLKAIREEEK